MATECDYCGGLYNGARFKCPNCGAPRKKQELRPIIVKPAGPEPQTTYVGGMDKGGMDDIVFLLTGLWNFLATPFRRKGRKHGS